MQPVKPVASSMYIGRFAPSPTGPLHFGSLLAALSSYLDARHHNGQWLVRIDDIDPPREKLGAASNILETLRAHHLFWDGDVRYQSLRSANYQRVLDQLYNQRSLYWCNCSRKTLQARTSSRIYDGFCRQHSHYRDNSAVRLRNDIADISWIDQIQGAQTLTLAQVGDFILKRRDDLWAYHLAVSVDDSEQQVTHIVRGSDLMPESAKQIALAKSLHFNIPSYSHIPVVVSSAGQKLSKQNFATALDNSTPVNNIFRALVFLGQHPPATLLNQSLNTILSWAQLHWNLQAVPRQTQKSCQGI